ncbi:unnamed protein product, partial [Porites lobata]
MRKLKFTGLNEATTSMLNDAKKRFERARERATEAFVNEALELSERVLAMRYRIMSTILETVDNPTNALAACKLCEGEVEHKLSNACGIATNTKGYFLIADNGDKSVKVFNRNGKFQLRFTPQTDDVQTKLQVYDVANEDVDDNIYLLVGLKKPGAEEWESEVQIFNTNGDLQHKFSVRK